jgi:hypothetical protein
MVGLGSVDMGASAGADDAERRMRFGHAQPDKMSFVDAVASTQLPAITRRCDYVVEGLSPVAGTAGAYC